MKRVGQPVKVEEEKEKEVVGYKCKFCGGYDCLIQLAQETVYSSGRVIDIDGSVDDYESDDYDNFQVNGFRCSECGQEGNYLEEMIAPVFEGGMRCQ